MSHSEDSQDRPYIDVVALADISVISYFRSPICVAVRVTNAVAATIAALSAHSFKIETDAL